MKNTLSLAIAALVGATPALAQSQGATPVEEVVVTGALERRTETGSRLGLTNRETPAIIDVLTQEDLQLQGLDSAVDALNAAPGVLAGTNPGVIGLGSMRGFTRGTNFQFDGVRTSTPGSEFRNWDSWSFERIEVLKGPGSVVSGDGALVGTVNFVPRRPVLGERDMDVLASFGSFDTARLAAGANLPMSDSAAARLDVVGSRTKGWIDDTDSTTLAANASILLRPTEALSLTFAIDRFEDDFDTAYYGTPLIPRSLARDPSGAASGPNDLVLDGAMRDVNFEVTDGDVMSDSTWYRSRIDLTLSGRWTFRNDLSYFDGFRSWVGADTYTFNAATNLIARSTSRITHDQQVLFDRAHFGYDGFLKGRRNRFTVGLETMVTDFATLRRFGSASSVDPFDPVRGLFPAPDTPANFGTRQQVRADIDNVALFVEDAHNLTDDLLLVGGIRIDDIELARSIEDVTSGAVTRYGNTYEPTNWRVGVVYDVAPETQLFAQYSSAVVPVSGFLFISAANATFDLTTGETYEVGVKSSAIGGRLELTASAYRIQQDDILTRDPINPNVTLQGGSQSSMGVEASVTAVLTEQLRLDVGIAVLEAEFDELIEAGGANRSGNVPTNTPERLADLTLTWAPRNAPLTVFGAIRHNGEFYTTNSNLYRVSAVTMLDAGITWRADFAEITLRGRNLTDELYAEFGFTDNVMIGQPRNVEVSLRRSF